MKKYFLLLSISVMTITGCNLKNQNDNLNTDTVKETVIQLAEKYKDAWNSENLKVINSIVAEGGMFCGTDPNEHWDKKSLIEMIKGLFSDPKIEYNYSVELRKVKLATNGNTAIMMEHIKMPGWSKLIMLRHTMQMEKVNDDWKINYISWGLISENENIEKLNSIIE